MTRVLALVLLVALVFPAAAQTPSTAAPPAKEKTEEKATEEPPAEEKTEEKATEETPAEGEEKATEETPAEGEEPAEEEEPAAKSGAADTILLTDLENVTGAGYDASANITFNSTEGSTDTIDGSYRYVWRSVAPKASTSGDFEISLNGTSTASENGDGDDTGTSSMTLTVDGSSGPSSDHASFSYDKYISQSFGRPTYMFIEPQVRFVSDASESGGEDTDGPDQFSAATTVGIGFGRVYPSASYERASSILKILKRERVLTRKETTEELQDLMGILKKRWEPTKDVLKALDYLKEKGLLVAGETPSPMVAEMVAIVEQSFDYKETGAEYRFGVNYNFITGDAQGDAQPLLIAASYTQIFGGEKLIVQPRAYFYKRIDEDTDASYGASLEIRYAKTPRTEWFFTDQFSPGSTNAIEAGWRYTLASFMTAEVKYTLDIPLDEAQEDPTTGETEDQEWPAALLISLKAGGRGL